MAISEKNLRLILGLKIRQNRQNRKYSLKELSDLSGLSISYLNEIEKGKKYPKADKIVAIAQALDIPYDDLVSLKLDRELNPLADLLKTSLLQDLPFDLFGIDSGDLMSLISEDPTRFSALVATLVEIARNYDVQVEQVFFAALRSYQEVHNNYFSDLENEADLFRKTHDLDSDKGISPEKLDEILTGTYGYEIDYQRLGDYPELRGFRSIFIPGNNPKLFVNNQLLPSQRAFVLGREIGHQFMNLKSRSYTSTWLKVDSFDQVFHHFKASYFAGALLLNRDRLINDLNIFFQKNHFDDDFFLDLLQKYNATPEMLLHRIAQLIPEFMEFNQFYFLRFNTPLTGPEKYTLTKELHFSRLHGPHGTELHEHYCRRWVTITILDELANHQRDKKEEAPIIRTQRSRFAGTEDEYLNISLARSLSLNPGKASCVTLGFLINDDFKSKVNFWNDPEISIREVNETCERCGISDCRERVASPKIFEQQEHRKKRDVALHEFIEKNRN